MPFFAYPESVRRIIYTINAIEALNAKPRRAIRAKGHFPNDDAAMKLLYLILDNWPAPGSEDTELGVLMGPEGGHGETEVHARVQA